jgi:hypothetical protein
MNKVLLVDELESFHDFDDDFNGLLEWEDLAWELSLVCQ